MPKSKNDGKYYTPKELLRKAEEYITHEGTIRKFTGQIYKGAPIYYDCHVLVTIKGLCEYMDVNVDYMTHLTLARYNKDKNSRADYSSALTRIKQKMSVHNDKGNSVGDINNKSYAIWKASVEKIGERVITDLDVKEQKEAIKRKKIENKYLESKIQSEIDWKESRTEANDVRTDQIKSEITDDLEDVAQVVYDTELPTIEMPEVK